MPRRIRIQALDSLLTDLNDKLKSFKADASKLSIREKVKRLVEISYKTKCLGVSAVVKHGLSETAAIERIKVYLQQNVGQIIKGEELEVVSGISEYARRIRQLRVEHGMKILTGASLSEQSDLKIKSDEYYLADSQPDADMARRWHVANRIRKQGGGAKSRLLAYFQENVQKVVTTEELFYVANSKKEFARRIRELRTEEGYAIATKFTGRPDLNMGEYVLMSTERVAVQHDRNIPTDVQKLVYERDSNTCRNPKCNWDQNLWTRQDPRILELHHIEHHAVGGLNNAENLIVLCSRCHDEVHAGRLDTIDFIISNQQDMNNG
jgi:hypothetical protein